MFIKQTSTQFSSLFLNTRKKDTLADIVNKIDYANNFCDKPDKIIFSLVPATFLTIFVSILLFDTFDRKKIISLLFLNFLFIFIVNNYMRHHFYTRIHYYANRNIKKLRNILNLQTRKIPLGRHSLTTNPDYYDYKY